MRYWVIEMNMKAATREITNLFRSLEIMPQRRFWMLIPLSGAMVYIIYFIALLHTVFCEIKADLSKRAEENLYKTSIKWQGRWGDYK